MGDEASRDSETGNAFDLRAERAWEETLSATAAALRRHLDRVVTGRMPYADLAGAFMVEVEAAMNAARTIGHHASSASALEAKVLTAADAAVEAMRGAAGPALGQLYVGRSAEGGGLTLEGAGTVGGKLVSLVVAAIERGEAIEARGEQTAGKLVPFPRGKR